MKRYEECPICKSPCTHGSAFYAYFKCGHAYEKPLNDQEEGRIIYKPSPYMGMQTAYDKWRTRSEDNQ